MAIQLSVGVRNGRLDQTVVNPTTGSMQIRTGAQPSDCSQASSGTLLWQINLPSSWMAAASGGTKAKAGVWSGAATAAGTAGYFRQYSSQTTFDGTTCIMQGSVGQGTGDLSLDNTTIANGQTITINTWTLTDGNA
jgi:hypothetical protein